LDYIFVGWDVNLLEEPATCTFFPKDEGSAFLENSIYVSDMHQVTCQNTTHDTCDLFTVLRL